MTNFEYSDDIPFATNDPSVDQPNMQTNTNSTDQLINVDHVSFNQNDGGYHKIIHQGTATRSRSGQGNTFTNFPGGIGGIGQVFTANYTPDYPGALTDTQLFSMTGASFLTGGISQLTGDSSQQDGWQWIGACLLQWGHVTTVLGGGTVTFGDQGARPGGIPFPNNCFNVQATTTYNSSGASSVQFLVREAPGQPSRTAFEWTRSGTSSGSFNGFFWMAVGN